MSDTRNDNSAFRVETAKKNKIINVRRFQRITLVLLFSIVGSSVMSGCGGLNELYFLTEPVYPTSLNTKEKRKLRTREIERRQFQYQEFGQGHLTCNDRYETTGLGIPIMTWRFGGGSSKTNLRKHYAFHRTNRSKHREFRSLNNVSKSLSYISPLSTKEVMPMR